MNKIINKVLIDEIRELYYRMKTPKEIAKITGLAVSTVYKMIEDESFCTAVELGRYSYCIEYLVKTGKISWENKFKNGKFYPFDLSDSDIKALQDEYMPIYEKANSEQEIEDYYEKLNNKTPYPDHLKSLRYK
jgi:hypothetical protein